VTTTSIVKVKLEVRLLDGKLKNPAAIRSNCHRISFFAQKPLFIGFRMALLSMCQGEVSWFRFRGKYNGCEETETDEENPKGSQKLDEVYFYKLELVDVQGPR
jgi:hypothetical protein